MKRIAAVCGLAVAIGSTAFSGAFAQATNECTCLLPPGPEGQSLGTIESFEGNVQVSQPAGFTGAAAGMEVTRGTRIIVGPGSRAVLDLGANCRRTIEENRDVEIDPLNTNICVKIIDPATGEVASAGNNVVGGVAAAAAVGGVAALIANSVSD